MAILWCGSEDIDFPNQTIEIRTTAGYYRAGYGRCAIRSSAGANSPLWTPQTSLWISFRNVFESAWNNPGKFAGVRDSATGACIAVGVENGVLYVYRWTGGAWSTVNTAGLAMTGGSSHKVDMEVVNWGTAATIRIYLDGTLSQTLTNQDCRYGTTATSGVDCMRIWQSVYGWMSEFIAATEDTRGLSVITQYPTATAGGNQWTGDHTTIDDTTVDDSDLIYVNANGSEIKMDLSDLPSGTFAIRMVKDVWRGVRGSSGVTGIAPGVVSGGTTQYDTTKVQDLVWTQGERLMPTNPVTGSAWTPAEVNAAQLALKAVT